jgi:RecG-like helicase
VAVIDELPAGRRPVRTLRGTAQDRAAAETLVRDEVAAGHQAFVVCAAIDDGNRSQVRAAEVEAERLRTDVFLSSRWRCCTGGCVRRRRSAPWSDSVRAMPTC